MASGASTGSFGEMRPRTLRSAALGLLLLASSPALAHGPTVKLSYARVQPAELTITVGQTVHFVNVNSAAGVVTVVEKGGSFESPPLARSEGWHHTFDEAGRFAFQVKEFPGREGDVVVVAPR